MAYLSPLGTDTLLSKDHAKMHNVVDMEATTPNGSLLFDASGNATFAHNVIVTGNLTVDTNTLFVDSVNHRTYVGSTTGTAKFETTVAASSANTLIGKFAGNNGSIGLYDDDRVSFKRMILKIENAVMPGDGLVVFSSSIIGDTYSTFGFNGTGKMLWGAGGASDYDTNLYRSATDTLKTDDSLIVAGSLFHVTNGLDTDSGSATFYIGGTTANARLASIVKNLSGSRNLVFSASNSTTAAGYEFKTATNATAVLITTTGLFGFGVTPTRNVGLLGTSARTLGMERHTTANTAGNSLTIDSGGATSGATDKNAGDLILATGLSTGTGYGLIKFKVSPPGSTGTADNALVDVIEVSATETKIFNNLVLGGYYSLPAGTVTHTDQDATVGGTSQHSFRVGSTNVLSIAGSESSGTITPLLGFYGATPVARHSSTGETAGFTQNSGDIVNASSTFTGNVGSTSYNLNDIVKALKNIGVLAQ